MTVIVSRKINSRFYHREDCLFVSQIPQEDQLRLFEDTAVRMGYCPCGCLKTVFSVSSYQEIPKLPELRGLSYDIDKPNNTIYVRTSCGFWKMLRNKDCLWTLYHRDEFDTSLTLEELKQGHFHPQTDTEKQQNPGVHAKYIRKHDIAKMIIAENYRKLPKKQSASGNTIKVQNGSPKCRNRSVWIICLNCWSPTWTIVTCCLIKRGKKRNTGTDILRNPDQIYVS